MKPYPLELSICLPTFNRLDHLKQTLNSIFDTFHSLSFEVIVVDGGSTDGTLDYLKELQISRPVVLIQQNELRGARYATQAGFDAARGKFIVGRIDHSLCILEPILTAMRILDAEPDIGLICERKYKHPARMDKAHLEAGFFGTTEEFIIRNSDKFQTDERYYTYGWARDRALQVLCSKKVTACLRDVSYIDLLLIRSDVLHEKFKTSEPNSPGISDTELFLSRSNQLQQVVANRLPIHTKLKLAFNRFIAFRILLPFPNPFVGRALAKLFKLLGYQRPPLNVRSVNPIDPNLLVQSELNMRTYIPFMQAIFDYFHERSCAFLDRTGKYRKYRDDLYLIQRLPDSLCDEIASKNIWNCKKTEL